MHTKSLTTIFTCFSLLFTNFLHAEAVVEDNFDTDGTGATDAMYFGSSNSQAVEFNSNSIGLVTGSSGRQMHAIFPTETLAFVGDAIKATVTFITPATVSAGSDDLRIGLFDHLERTSVTELGQNTSYSTGSPSPLFQGLFGYYLELDVESADSGTDLDIRRSSPSNTGRLIGTNTGFTPLGSTPDVGYAFAANTTYTVVFTFAAIAENGLSITTDFTGFGDDGSNTVIDLQPLSYSFGMLAMGASTNAFGSSNANDGGTDNGIEITNFVIEVVANPNPVTPVTPFVPEPPEPPVDPDVTQVVNDDLATDGTAATDAMYFGSSTSGAIEINANSVGLVSGSSSRQIHALFPTQTLSNAGDVLNASITFTTPATVGASGEDIRLGLFDPLDRSGADKLGQNTSYSSGTPNADYNDLPGYFFEIDVESADAATDFDIRRHDIGQVPTTSTGRLLSTTSGFSSLSGSSGPDIGYAIVADTSYTIDLSVTRTEADGLDIAIALTNNTLDTGLGALTLTDASPGSFDFGMFGMGASGGAFGSSNTNDGGVDNGIEITNFTVDLIAPTVVVEADIGFVVNDDFAADGTVDTDASYFSSSTASGIEFNAGSIGLVSGSSGRQIHAMFPANVTLSQPGDIVRTSVTFTTSDTVSIGGDDFRLGVFDHLGRTSEAELGTNTTFSSGSPNPLFQELPGYFVELDVESASQQSDLQIRRHNVGQDPIITTGRLLNTTNGWTDLGNSEDIAYTMDPNTTYTINLTIERTEADELDITADFFGREFKVIDAAPASFDFGMLALNSSSAAFGVSNVPLEADNGIDINNVTVQFIRTAVVNDDLATDGTATTDASYFGSSTSGAIEINANSVGLVSGSSSRQIHTLFTKQTLSNAGDAVTASVTFTTPATVASGGEDIRLGFFDPLDRSGVDKLGQNTSYSSGSPNADYNDLPGYLFEVDVESADAATDFDIRRHDIGQDPTTSTGRLLSTTGGFNSLPGSSGPDVGYTIVANTSYTIVLSAMRTEADGLDITIALSNNTLDTELGALTLNDATPGSFDFGMFGMGASGGAFGTSNSNDGGVDNGIEITNFTVGFEPFIELIVVDLPPIVPPTGDHPDVEIIPTVPSGDPGDGTSDDDSTENSSGEDAVNSNLPSSNIIAALPSILSLVLFDDEAELTNAELVARYFDLNPNSQPWENFDLSDWALDTPDADNGPIVDPAGNIFGNGDTFSARTNDFHFGAGALFPGSEPFFFTGSDGAMVFKSTVFGARTSQNTSFVRSELREMLRAGDENIGTQGVNANNWALDHQPLNEDIGARGGKLTATMSIDQVTTTGSASQVGRVIIGQIHASGDEPMRLYYRKLPGNTKGSLYAAHEIRDSNDILFDLIGSRSDSAADPIEDGISLGELFSYEIINVGSTLEVIVRRGDSDGEVIAELTLDMLTANVGGTSSGYELEDEWMYFKAGAYSQNNTGWANDFDQVRIYRLENSH
jgi:hypothetical protein